MKILKSVFCVSLILFFGCKESSSENGSMVLQTLIKSYEDHEAYGEDEFPLGVFTKEHYQSEFEFAEKKLREPDSIFKGYESSYNNHIVSDFRERLFYSLFKKLPEILTNNQRDSVLQAAQVAIEENVTPQFKIIKAFFEEEYLPKTRTTIGVSETPNGAEYYQDRINVYINKTKNGN